MRTRARHDMRIGYALGLAALLLCGPMRAKEAPTLSGGRIARIETMIASFMATNHVPGMSVAIVIDGKPAWSRGFGCADVENKVATTSATAYRSASIGKTMTATATRKATQDASAPAIDTRRSGTIEKLVAICSHSDTDLRRL